jgi:positive regulator of sigma E activity
MFVFVLILLLLAAIFGILDAVLKTVAFLVITAILTVTVLGLIAWWVVKRSAKKFAADYDQQVSHKRVTEYRANEADPGSLPPGRDDRY